MLVRRSTMRSQRMRPVIERKFLPSMAALLAFEAVGRLGGIRRAAKELMIDHAVVSRHVRALEAWTGAKLIERDGNSAYRLTPRGLAYHAQIHRSEERRVGKECVSTCSSRWLPFH